MEVAIVRCQSVVAVALSRADWPASVAVNAIFHTGSGSGDRMMVTNRCRCVFTVSLAFMRLFLCRHYFPYESSLGHTVFDTSGCRRVVAGFWIFMRLIQLR